MPIHHFLCVILSHGGGLAQSAIQWTRFEKHTQFKLPPCGNVKVFLMKFNSEFSGDSSEKLEVKMVYTEMFSDELTESNYLNMCTELMCLHLVLSLT